MAGWTYENPDGWTIEHPPKAAPPPKPPPASFAPTSAFVTEMDSQIGKGKWRDTGDYRTPGREDQLRSQGAATVRPGAVSPHSRGTPDAPGAHDFVIPGETSEQMLAKARGMPGVKDAFWEGRSGTQGGHVHVDMADTTGWKFEHPQAPGWQVDPPTSAPKPTTKPAAKPQGDGSVLKPAQGLVGDIIGEERHGFQEDIAEANQPQNVGNPIGGIVSGFDMIQRAIAGVTVPLEQRDPATQGMSPQHARDRGSNLASVATMALPLPGAEEVEAAGDAIKGAARAGREALAGGREAAAGADAARLRTNSLPKPKEWSYEKPGPAPKQRTLAAAVEAPPRTDIVGDEPQASTRTANALYRLGGHDTDARIELGRTSTALRKEHGPETDEALYHALEEPDKPMTPEVAAAKKELDPLLQRQTAVINRLRERADPTLDPYLTDSGYVHRIKAGDETALDTDAPRSPFETRKSLVKKADSQKARKFITLENSQTGERTLVDTSERPEFKDYRPGQEYRPEGEGPHGVAPAKFKVVSPTTKEIEAKVPGLKFQKSAIHNTAVNVYQLERAERNLDILEQTLQDMKERGVAHKEYSYPMGSNGLRDEISHGSAPKGFASIPDNPQFKGWKFDHSDAQVQELKDWLPKTGEDPFAALDRLNNFMLRSNFLSPFVHPKNIAEFWGASRGFDWLHPEGYGRLARTLPEATREVLTMGPKYRQLLREGSALLSADSRTQKFTTLLTDTAAKQIIDDPQGFATIKKAFGDVVSTPAKLYQSFQKASHNMMWSMGDIMMMQRVLELQEKGMPIRDAIRKAEDVIPNYRVPAQLMDNPTMGRILSKTFSNNRLFSIGRYHYNRLAAWGKMFKKIAKGTPEEKAEAAGQLLVVAIQGAIIAPLMDKALQIATGNQNARVKRGGITSLPDAAEGVASGREAPAQAIAQILDVSPEAELGYEEIKQKDYFGDDVYSKYRSGTSNVAHEAELPLSQFGPLQGGLEALQPGYGPERVAGNMFGVDLPQKPQGAVKGSTAKMLRGKYRKQDRKDPFVQGLQALSQ